MTVAFSSLLLSDTAVLNQFGFVLVAASVADTFIVRTLLVPALMFFAVESNWFPGKVPQPTRTEVTDGTDSDSDSDSDNNADDEGYDERLPESTPGGSFGGGAGGRSTPGY